MTARSFFFSACFLQNIFDGNYQCLSKYIAHHAVLILDVLESRFLRSKFCQILFVKFIFNGNTTSLSRSWR